jgi:phosphatidylglycerophosphate synthase
MLDGIMRQALDPTLDRAAKVLAHYGICANHITLVGLAIGLFAASLIATGYSGWVALAPLLVNRVADGLDGAVARVTQPSDFGGFLDIVSDFIFYGAIPFAFVMRDPTANGVAGAFLLTAFYANGSSFLAFAILAAKRGLQTDQRGVKSLYFTTETIVFFAAICLFPSYFSILAWVFGGMCFLTALLRVVLAWRVFGAKKQ